jgi:hypothetical protein
MSYLVGEIQTLQASIITLQHQNAELLNMLSDMGAKIQEFETKQQPLVEATFDTQKTILCSVVLIGLILAFLYSNSIDPGTVGLGDQVVELVNNQNILNEKYFRNLTEGQGKLTKLIINDLSNHVSNHASQLNRRLDCVVRNIMKSTAPSSVDFFKKTSGTMLNSTGWNIK